MKLKTITIKEYLEKNKISFQQLKNELVICCPFCNETLLSGDGLATFYINQTTGEGSCYVCKAMAEFPEVIEKFGIEDRLDEIIDGKIIFNNEKAENILTSEKQNLPPRPEELIDISQFSTLSSEELIKILGLTIKRDEENKLITFLTQLSAYTESDQLNVSFNAPSSTGKSYIPTEIAQLFPEEDIIELAYCSPTAFFHDRTKEYKKETNELVVDLSRKILIFLDQPHTLLLQHLRPLLSHDKKEIKLKITDKAQRGGLRTKNVFLRGFPSVIFCTAGLKVDEQETTRFILLSPETNAEKIREAIYQKIKKEADNEDFRSALDNNPERKLLKERIRAIKQTHVEAIKIALPEIVEREFFKKNKRLKPRHQRDIGRILSLIKAFALLNVWFREKRGSTVIANGDDIKEAFKVWDVISESQEFNLPPYIYQIYKDVILPAWHEKNKDDVYNDEPVGVTRREITQKHSDVYGRVLADWLLRQQIIPMLENAGLISQEADTNDKRKILIYPTTPLTISAEQNCSELDGVVKQSLII